MKACLIKNLPSFFLLLICMLEPVSASSQRYLRVEQNSLVINGHSIRNIGVNIHGLLDSYLTGEDAQAESALKSAYETGALFACVSFLPADPALFQIYTSNPSRWDEAFNKMFAAASRNHLWLIPYLLGDRSSLLGILKMEGKPDTFRDVCTKDSSANQFASGIVSNYVSRYRHSTQVLFWMIGSDLNRHADAAPPSEPGSFSSEEFSAFLKQTARLIHKTDKNHLVCSGNGAIRPDAWHLLKAREEGYSAPAPPPYAVDTLLQFRDMLALLNPPGIDIISLNFQPPGSQTPLWLTRDDNLALTLPWAVMEANRLKKPLFVASFGETTNSNGKETDAPWLVDFMRRMQESEMPPAALSSWYLPGAIVQDQSVSPEITPRLALAMKTANVAIERTKELGAIVTIGAPLPDTQEAVDNELFRSMADNLRGIARKTLINIRAENSAAASLPESALYAEGDLVSSKQAETWVSLFAEMQIGKDALFLSGERSVPPYSVPEEVSASKLADWYPAGAIGALPPADAPFWFIILAHAWLQLIARPSLFNSSFQTSYGSSTLKEICIHAFDSIQTDPSTGLVMAGVGSVPVRSDWIFTDRVKKQGLLLAPSLLRYKACLYLAEMLNSVKDIAAAKYTTLGDKIRGSLVHTFYSASGTNESGETGMLISSTGGPPKEDIWASAMAVSMDALPSAQSAAIAKHLLALFNSKSITSPNGYVRALPRTGVDGWFWPNSFDIPDSGQNGGYWGFAIGWLALALRTVQISAANRVLQEFISSMPSAPALLPEWVGTGSTSGPLSLLPLLITASTLLPNLISPSFGAISAE